MPHSLARWRPGPRSDLLSEQARIPVCPELTSASVCSEFSHCQFSRWFQMVFHTGILEGSEPSTWVDFLMQRLECQNFCLCALAVRILAMSLDSAEKSHRVWGENESPTCDDKSWWRRWNQQVLQIAFVPHQKGTDVWL